MDALRSQLHALADSLADALAPRAPQPPPPSGDDERALAAALEALARGELSRALTLAPAGARDVARAALHQGLLRVRGLAVAARGAAQGRDPRLDEARVSAERAAEAATRLRVALERAAEQVRQLTQRSVELAQASADAADASEHAALLSLNAGVEGLRVGGEAARALTALGEELRKLAQRSANGARDVAGALLVLGDTSRGLAAALDEAREAAVGAGEGCARAAGLTGEVRRADDALASAVEGFRVYDDDTEAQVAELQRLAELVAQRGAAARGALAKARPSGDGAGSAALEAALEALARAAATGAR